MEVSTWPIIIFFRGCVPEMFVTSYSVTYWIYISDALEASNMLVDNLRKQLKANDEEVAALRDEVDALKVRHDDLEQHGRRGSMRVFGVPEHTTGTVDHKVLSLVNEHLKVTPPLVLEDIEVAHRLGKPPPKPHVCDPDPSADTSTDVDPERTAPADGQHISQPVPPSTSPRAIIVKFASRRTKARVMEKKKNLKTNPFKAADGSTHTVYIADDLTKRRANLAYQARMLKRANVIRDTWTFDSKILIKNLHNKIFLINSEKDLNKYKQPANDTEESD